MPRYVVSSTLQDASWTNTTVLSDPTILGSGRKLFGQTGAPVTLQLVSATPLGPDGVLLIYRRRLPGRGQQGETSTGGRSVCISARHVDVTRRVHRRPQ